MKMTLSIPSKIESEKNSAGSSDADWAKASEFNRKGLFIGGAAKSGTTLLMSLLDHHPQLVVLPEETGYIEHRKQYLKLKNNRAKLKKLMASLAALGSDSEFSDASPGCSSDTRTYAAFDYQRFTALAESFIQRPGLNDSLLFSEVIRAYGITAGLDWENCAHWVEKTPRTESHPATMDELFPDAKLLQIVRDPRAVFASFKNRIINRYGCHAKAHRLPRSWNRSAREIPRLRRDPSRFLVIRYEDLVKNPEETLKKICRFGGFDFCGKMLKPTRAGSIWEGNSAFNKAFQRISTATAEQWKDCLSEPEIWWIELHCRRGMELAGYSFQTDARFSLRRWLKRLPGESWSGYLRARRGSLCQWLGLLKDCRYDVPSGNPPIISPTESQVTFST